MVQERFVKKIELIHERNEVNVKNVQIISTSAFEGHICKTGLRDKLVQFVREDVTYPFELQSSSYGLQFVLFIREKA